MKITYLKFNSLDEATKELSKFVDIENISENCFLYSEDAKIQVQLFAEYKNSGKALKDEEGNSYYKQKATGVIFANVTTDKVLDIDKTFICEVKTPNMTFLGVNDAN
ncbi:MAG: hypothetical protein ACK5LP_05145 [Campylobacteraceae bacterium]